MRSIAIFVIVAVIAITNAQTFEEPDEGKFLYHGTEDQTENSLKFAIGVGADQCCTNSLCEKICLANGFRPPFAYRCVGCDYCECMQLK